MHNVTPHLANPCPEAQVLPGAALQHRETRALSRGYNTWAAALNRILPDPSGQGKATRGTAALNSKDLRALSFQLFNQQFTESQFSVKSNLSLLAYISHNLFDHHLQLVIRDRDDYFTPHGARLAEPSAQLQDRSCVLTALGAWKSILMGRVFEGEDFCMAVSQMCLSTRISLFIMSHFIK